MKSLSLTEFEQFESEEKRRLDGIVVELIAVDPTDSGRVASLQAYYRATVEAGRRIRRLFERE